MRYQYSYASGEINIKFCSENVKKRDKLQHVCAAGHIHVILGHVNPLLGIARNTHTAKNGASVFSLCPSNLRMRNDVTLQQCFTIT
jgi:hypothetical protein